jgi:hypothetical protein
VANKSHLVCNNGNKMVAIALLIALVRRTLNQSIFLTARQDSANGHNQACSKTAAQRSFVPNKRVKSSEASPCQSKMPLIGKFNL